MEKEFCLNKIWKPAAKEYKLLSELGQGSFGQVIKAKHRVTKRIVAIKMVKITFKSVDECRHVLREIMIMRQLTQMKNNVFTTKLLDIILPPEAEEDLLAMTHLFLVQDFVEHDLKKLFTVDTPPNFSDMHVMVILYNLLCALNYIHTANLMHRDLKPANILINDECAVKLCDFGLSRTVPVYEDDANNKFINAQLQAAEQSDNSQDDTAESPDQPTRRPSRFQEIQAQALIKNRNERAQVKRQLSSHISSRWYRAPEIILNEKKYNQQMDQWSLGCILAELIFLTKKDPNDATKKPLKERFLFPGSSCFPLSPCPEMKKNANSETNIVSNSDQMITILQVIGKQDPCSLSFISEQSVIDYCNSIQESITPTSLEQRFSGTMPQLSQILQETIQFNPHFRSSAFQLLRHKCFDQFRVAQLEEPAPFQVQLVLDQPDSFDYIDFINHKLDVSHYQAILIEEIQIIKSMKEFNFPKIIK